MLSALRRSLVQTTQRTRATQLWAVQSRALSYTVLGTEWRADGSLGSSTAASASVPAPAGGRFCPSAEFDVDHADFVSKEVSIHDRQLVRPYSTPAQTVKSQEDDYDSPNSAPSCWGRTDSTNSGTIPPPFFEAYEQPLEDPTTRKIHKGD